MGFYDNLIENLPEVAGPTQKRLAFNEKLKWTLIMLVTFFVLSLVPLFGLGQNALSQFEYLSVILGASFGSLMTLGIGPIVTASIVLQLMNGSGILKFDLTKPEGKKRFQGTQKILAVFFIIFEGAIFVLMGGLSPTQALIGTAVYKQLQYLLIFQIFLGGILVLFMDEVVAKWGFGSGISLFIAANVSKEIFVRALSWLPSPTNPGISTGAVPALFQSLAQGDPLTAALMFSSIVATILVFVMAVYASAMKIEIPLSFGRVRGHGMRWPLSFIYTSNIPVILVAALLANIKLWGRLLQNWGHPFFGTYVGNTPVSGLVSWVDPPQIVRKIITSSLSFGDIFQAFMYLIIFMAGCVLFSYFWVQTAGMDARSQAKQIMASGLQIPGFRKDERVLERLLQRYIGPLTILGALAVGVLAAIADLAGALSGGTGLLLAVMIIYRMYEDIAKQHMMELNPGLRKIMK